jgi:hypothetical protein
MSNKTDYPCDNDFENFEPEDWGWSEYDYDYFESIQNETQAEIFRSEEQGITWTIEEDSNGNMSWWYEEPNNDFHVIGFTPSKHNKFNFVNFEDNKFPIISLI